MDRLEELLDSKKLNWKQSVASIGGIAKVDVEVDDAGVFGQVLTESDAVLLSLFESLDNGISGFFT